MTSKITNPSLLKQKIQSGQGLKILTTNQMLSRLPIYLAQLNAGKDQKNLQKISIKAWLTLFKHGNSLFEH